MGKNSPSPIREQRFIVEPDFFPGYHTPQAPSLKDTPSFFPPPNHTCVTRDSTGIFKCLFFVTLTFNWLDSPPGSEYSATILGHSENGVHPTSRLLKVVPDFGLLTSTVKCDPFSLCTQLAMQAEILPGHQRLNKMDFFSFKCLNPSMKCPKSQTCLQLFNQLFFL